MVRKRRSAGFTLTEAVLVAAIVGLVSSIGAGILIQIQKFFMLSQARIQLQEEARSAMYVITRQLHEGQAGSIVLDRSSNTQPYYSRITFYKIPNPTHPTGVWVVFDQVGGKLIMTEGSQQSILAKDLAYVSFTFPNASDQTILSVSFTLQRVIYQGQIKALHMASQQVQVMN